jgi:methylmalonyl-CoA mutase
MSGEISGTRLDMSDDVAFAAAFPPATVDQWRAIVDKALKGAPFEKRLVTRLYEGIAVQPLYTADDWKSSGDPSGFPGFSPFTRGGHASGTGTEGWQVLTEITLLDVKQANKAILADLMRGATAIDLHIDRQGYPGIEIDTLDDLDQVLNEVLPELVPLSLNAGHHAVAAAAMLAAFWRRRSVPNTEARGGFNVDPIGTLAALGNLPESIEHALSRLTELAIWMNGRYPNVTAVGVDSSPYYEAGATEIQDLAAAMSTGVAYLRALTAGGVEIDAALRQMTFTMAVGCDQFLTIAKLRAARRLWARIAEACGASESARTMRLRARTARRIMSQRDPWVNMLRTTVAGFAAGAAGADSVTIMPFDATIGVSDDFARRIARNTQILLKEEAYVSRVTDPAGGSWYVETLTEQLAQAAWNAFQSIEGRGGIIAVLFDGTLAAEIASSWTDRQKNVARRKDALTGVSEFPNILEPPVERTRFTSRTRFANPKKSKHFDSVGDAILAIEAGMPLSAVSANLASGSPAQITPLPQHRIHEDFEALRDAADRHKQAVGAWPTIFLVNMGTVAQHTARSTFSKNFFEAGGIQALGNDGFLEPSTAAEAFRKSGARIAILCGSDALYETDTASFAAALKGAGVEHLFQAGNPGQNKEKYENAGVDEFISIGMDVLSVLRSTLLILGVTL